MVKKKFQFFFVVRINEKMWVRFRRFQDFFLLRKNMFEKSGRIFPEIPLSANLFRLKSLIQMHAGSRGAARIGVQGGEASQKKRKKKMYNFFFKNIFLLFKNKLFFLKII